MIKSLRRILRKVRAADREDVNSSLRAYLRSLGPDPIYYKTNSGNGGDALIAHATYELFDQEGIEPRIWVEGDDASGKVVLYGGGGNLVEYYSRASSFIAQHHDRAERLIILPHTVSDHATLLGALGPNVVIFCRERHSYDYVRVAAPRADVRLAHDLALDLEPDEILRKRPAVEGAAPRYLEELTKFSAAWLERRKRERITRVLHPFAPRILHAFREDVEQTDVVRPADNIDLSASVPVEFGFLDRSLARLSSFVFFDCIRRYGVVRTNRLHIAIAAALLGKRVHLYDNSYWKNYAVYKHSLAERFPKLIYEGVPQDG